MSALNPCGRTRNVDDPYEVWLSADGLCEWRVLKKYQGGIPRWKCAVKTPETSGSWEYGTVYVDDITTMACRVYIDPALDFFAGVRPDVYATTMAVPDLSHPGQLLDRENFPDLAEYFVEEGMSFHTTDALGNALFFVNPPAQDCFKWLIVNWAVSHQQTGKTDLRLNFMIYDRPEDPVTVPFIYNLERADHTYEAIRFVEQETLTVYLLSLENNHLRFYGAKNIALTDKSKQDLSAVISDILISIEPNSTSIET